MEPATVTRRKTRFCKSIRRLCRLTGSKIGRCVNETSKLDVDSASNRHASAPEHSLTEQHSGIRHQFPNTPQCTSEKYSRTRIPDSEQYSINDISTPSTSDKSNHAQQSRLNIDTLPDVVLLHLFTYLNAQDLCNLGWCAPNLYNIARSRKKFWQNVDHTCNGSSPCHRLLRPFLSECTTTLHLSKGTDLCSSNITKGRKDTCVELNFFKSLKNLPNLKSLTLEDHSLDCKQMLNLKCLPKSLIELKLRRITLDHCLLIAFKDLHLYLPNLEIVDVSHCSWMNSHILCSLSQCPRLKKLIMFGCTEFNYVVPYLAVATMNGFWELETLDLRLTYATFNDIKIFKKLRNLKHILLERPKQSPMGACRRQNLLNTNRLDFNQESQVYQLQPLAITTDISPADSTSSRRIFRLSEYFNVWVETLVVRNYSEVTDSTLFQIQAFFHSVKYLDVTGTKCTDEKVATFQNLRPEVRVLHD